MLDHLPVVVDQVERRVRSDREIDRPEPAVGRGQELAIVLRPARDEGRAALRPQVPVHEVLRRLRHERRARSLAREQAAGVERHPARRGELARLREQLEARVAGDRIDLRVAAVVGHVLHRAGGRQRRVAGQVTRRDHLVASVVRVVEREVVAPLVEGVAELRAPGARLDLPRVQPEAHRVSADRELGRARLVGKAQRRAAVAEQLGIDHGTRRPFVREVDPVVEAEDGGVDGVLRVREREAGEDLLALLRLAVAVRVLQVPDVGRGGDEHALAVTHHARRQHEPVGEHAAALEAAVAVAILEQPDAAGGPGVERIARHLDHEQAPVLVEIERDRRGDVRLGRHELDRVAGFELERLAGLVGSEGRDSPVTGRQR
jgi:hypothetical protein